MSELTELQQLKIDGLGKYFIKEMIDTYGLKLIDTALAAYQSTIDLLKVGITAPNNLAINVFSEIGFFDLLHGGAIRGYRTQELAAIKRYTMPAAERQYVMNLYGVNQSQIDAADWRVKITDLSLNIPYPAGWSGMKEVFYEAHDRRTFPKIVSDVAFEKVMGYGDLLLKGTSIDKIGGGIKTFVEAAKIGSDALTGAGFTGASTFNSAGLNEALKEARKITASLPLPTSQGATQ